MKFTYRLCFCLWWQILLIVVCWMSRFVSCEDNDKTLRLSDYERSGSLRVPETMKEAIPINQNILRSEHSGTITIPEMGQQNFKIRRKRDDVDTKTPPTDTDPLVAACKNARPPSPNPLRCYRCTSNTKKDKEPLCDHQYWKYIKHSEKTRLRQVCNQDGRFCYKKLKQRLGERITERGCYGSYVMGPNQTKVESQNGCITYNEGIYRATLCLCNTTDVCNSAHLVKIRSNYYLTIVILVSVISVNFL